MEMYDLGHWGDRTASYKDGYPLCDGITRRLAQVRLSRTVREYLGKKG